MLKVVRMPELGRIFFSNQNPALVDTRSVAAAPTDELVSKDEDRADRDVLDLRVDLAWTC